MTELEGSLLATPERLVATLRFTQPLESASRVRAARRCYSYNVGTKIALERAFGIILMQANLLLWTIRLLSLKSPSMSIMYDGSTCRPMGLLLTTKMYSDLLSLP